MTQIPLPDNELDRLRALLQCKILDTAPEVAFDDFVRLAAQICNTPIALISLIDSERQWFKAKVGLDAAETSRNIAFCDYAILQSDPLIVPDTLLDPRFQNNPLVTGEPYIRFYTGVPLVTLEGYRLGTLCAIDKVPRELKPDQLEGLKILARQVTRQLELRRHLSDLEHTLFERQASRQTGQMLQPPSLARRMLWGAVLGVAVGASLATFQLIGAIASAITTHALESTGQSGWLVWLMTGLQGLTHTLPGLNQQGLLIVPLIVWLLYRGMYQQQRIKDVLKTERDFTTAILDTVGALVVVFDVQGKIVRFNRTCERITGYSFEEVRNRSVWDVLLPTDERATVQAQFANLQPDQFPRAYEGSWLTKQGQEHPIAWVQTALLDPSGAVQYVIATGLDMTDRRQAQAASSQLAAIVESSNDAIIGIALDGSIQSWNAGAERIYGYSQAEVYGKLITLLTVQSDSDPDLATTDYPSIAQFLERHETQHVRKDGRWIHVSLTPSPIRAIDGRVIGTSIIARDTSAQMAMERMKDEFIAMVSHELRTPLASLRGSLELLLTGRLGELSHKGQRMLEIALANSNRLISLINNILDVDPNNYQLSKRSCDIADIIQAALESVRAIANEAEISISTSTISALMYADSTRLTQVFEQLLQNAIKFSSKHGRVTITVEPFVEPSTAKNDSNNISDTSPETHILIRVEDQGIGISTDRLETVFERFHQVDASNARIRGGTGLGLAICRNLVEQHQGRIWVESCLGVGSTFYVVLPCMTILRQANALLPVKVLPHTNILPHQNWADLKQEGD
ncbi:PAS domain S-box protein [Oscillatoria sp. FACHB-1407]|uniref:PAS domain S-box protein n=1 Tax=Oscillatoria sp. FACHB-1407 TaxID=2692847 RepID=UPI001683BD4B|nr:PAS domain S-box protein [Oscillatoria sp. FACHB-1407]MBD2465117.1 PAS domain S-box protein [Oscillatoria sp. FACHB-1407]